MKRLLFLIITIALFMAPSRAHAQAPSNNQIIKVSPVIQQISLEPGSTQLYEITVENLLEVPLPLSASVEGFGPADEDGGISFDNPQDRSPLIGWTTLQEKDMILNPKEIRRITFTVNIPSTVPVGGYYAVIFLSPLLPSQSGQASVVPRIGVLLLASVGIEQQLRPDEKAKIMTFSFDKSLYQDTNIKALLRVKNNALTHFVAKPTFFIKPLFGESQEINWEEKTILPGKVRRWEKALENSNLSYGIYDVVARVSIGGGDYIVQKNYFVVFPWGITAVIMGFVCCTILIIKKKSNIKRALGILFAKNT